MKKITKLRFAGALAAGLGFAALGLGGIASTAAVARGDQAAARGVQTTIKIVGRSHGSLAFEGPDSVDEDTILRIVNRTDHRQVGPHTFSLVRHRTYPGPRELRDCAELKPGTICREIAKWHDFFGPGGPQNTVDAKAPGWDKMGDFDDTGDSWIANQQGDEELRPVSHEQKGALHFICAVHPEMRGKIDVNQLKGQ